MTYCLHVAHRVANCLVGIGSASIADVGVVQMPAGVPVASVGIDSSENAALLAAQIVAFKLPGLSEKLLEHKAAMEEKVSKASSETAFRG